MVRHANYKKFGLAIRLIRETLKMSQNDLGDKINCHAQYISNIERGSCSMAEEYILDLIKLMKTNNISDLIPTLQKAYIQDSMIKAKRRADKWR